MGVCGSKLGPGSTFGSSMASKKSDRSELNEAERPKIAMEDVIKVRTVRNRRRGTYQRLERVVLQSVCEIYCIRTKECI